MSSTDKCGAGPLNVCPRRVINGCSGQSYQTCWTLKDMQRDRWHKTTHTHHCSPLLSSTFLYCLPVIKKLTPFPWREQWVSGNAKFAPSVSGELLHGGRTITLLQHQDLLCFVFQIWMGRNSCARMKNGIDLDVGHYRSPSKIIRRRRFHWGKERTCFWNKKEIDPVEEEIVNEFSTGSLTRA